MNRGRLGSAAFASFDEVAALTPEDQVEFLDKMVSEAIAHTSQRRRQHRLGSGVLRLATLLLGASATIILGLAKLPPAAEVAFAFTAIITLLNALEPFFNFRGIWVVQEDALWRFRQIQEELRFGLVRTKGKALDAAQCRELFDKYEEVWTRASMAWIKHRRSLGDN